MLNIYEICKEMLPKLMDTDQEGKAVYTFVVDHPAIAENILAYGCNAVLVTCSEELKEICEVISAHNRFSKNMVVMLCCSAKVNEALAEAFQEMRVIPNGAYLLYGKRKLYYQAHPIELDERLDKLIASITDSTEKSTSGLVRNSNGLIKASSKDNSLDEIANYIIEKYDIVNIDNELCINSHNRIYELFTPDKAERVLLNELYNSYSSFRKEIFTYISHFAPKAHRTNGYIAFKNCVFGVESCDIFPYTDDMYFTSYIPHKFLTDSSLDKHYRIVDKFLTEVACGDEELKEMLLDLIAYCLYEGNLWQKTFFLCGDGGNGKGVFFRLLESILGRDNVTYRSWNDLTSSTGRFGIIDKSLVLCNDIDNLYLKEVQALKTLTACEPQTVKQLYRDEFTATFKGKIISSGNSIPRVNDNTSGWGRRLVIIPFNADFRANPDPTLASRLCSEGCIESLLSVVVLRLESVLKNGFKQCKAVDKMLMEYQMENNPVLQFVSEYGESFTGAENAKALDIIYSSWYIGFCKDNCYKPLSKLGFAKRIRKAGVSMMGVYGTNKNVYYIKDNEPFN